MVLAPQRVLLEYVDPTALFVSRLNALGGGLRAFWLPKSGDTTTNTSSPDTRVWTHSASQVGRTTPQGNGILVSLSKASSHKISTPDTDDLSFGNGTNDSAMSVIALANVTDTATYRVIFGKDANEYELYIDMFTDNLRMNCRDASAAVWVDRVIDAAAPQGAPHLYGMSYDGGGGATAMNGVALYQDGVAQASTVTNNANYVAMENLTTGPTIGAAGSSLYFEGSLGFFAAYAANLSAAEHLAAKNAAVAYFGLAI